MRYTDEEMSRILSAHEGGQLVRLGKRYGCPGMGCANQVAYGHEIELGILSAPEHNIAPATWFDNNYEESMSPEELIEHLDREGDE